MSAWLCSPKHLSILVNAAQTVRPANGGVSKQMREDFKMLLTENLKSLRARYDDGADEWHAAAKAYRMDSKATAVKAADVIKLAHSYAYQSNEHDGWETSKAREYIRDLVWQESANVIGYNDAPWEV